MEKKRYRTAVVGCGSIAQTHLDVLTKSDYAEVVGLCDNNAQKATATAERFGLAVPTFTDYREMLDTVKPDFLHICTPHDLHCEMTCEALARDIHVYLEKPIAISLPEIDRLLKAERESRGRVCVSFQNRTIPTVRLLEQLIKEAGAVRCARGMVTWDRDERYYGQDDWHGIRAREGGGLMINQAIHTLDLLLTLFGEEPITVQGQTALYRNRGRIDVEDNAQLLLQFKGEKTACFYATNNYGTDASNFLEFLCEDGSRICQYEGHIYKNGVRMDTQETLTPLTHGKSCWGRGHAYCIGEFYEAVQERAPVPVSLSSAALCHRVLFALYRSAGEVTPIL